jgi:hypothetical protein
MARQFGRECWEKLNATANLTTGDIKAAANDLEAFIVSNTTALNNALPVPFRTTATTPQKRLLLALVACEMAGILNLGD